MAELEKPALIILKALATHGVEIMIGCVIGLMVGLLISVLLLGRLKKKLWLKRANNWKYVAWIHYPALPIVFAMIFLQLGGWWAAKHATKSEIHRLREYTEEQTREFFVNNYDLITDTSLLKNGHLDSFIVNEIRKETEISNGSVMDRIVKTTVKAGTRVLLYVLTDRAADVVGIKKKHLDKLVDSYLEGNPEQVHSALMDIIEHLAWVPVRSYLISLLFGMLGIGLLVLLPLASEIYFNGRKYKKSLTTDHPQD